MKLLNILISIIFSVTIINAQIPNSGFENWENDNTPQDWSVNFLGGIVSRSSTAFNGSYAVKLEVDNSGVLPGITSKIFSIKQAYRSMAGHYQFQSNNGSGIFYIYGYFWQGGTLVGSCFSKLGIATSYKDFSLDITYFDDTSVPDSALISVILSYDSLGLSPGQGSFALLDELSFGNATEVKQLDAIPVKFSLKQNYPNPFNPTTAINYSIPLNVKSESSNITLIVYDVIGRQVKTLLNKNQQPGNYLVQFDASNLPSGIYYYRLKAGNNIKTKKMILLK